MESVKSITTCSATMRLLGDFWTLRIIDELSRGEQRFCELQRHLDNVNPVTLTKRLKTLEETHLIQRREEAMDKISVSYALTPLGSETLPVITALTRFSEKASSYPA